MSAVDGMLRERADELAIVSAALERARAGAGSSILVTARAGLGRSAFLDTVAAASEKRGVRVLRARAAPMEQSFGFGVARQLLESPLFGAAAGIRDDWLRGSASYALLALFGETGLIDDDDDDEPTATPHTVLHGLSSLVAQMCAEQPLVLLVDDVQWMDEPSLAWWGYLGRRLDRMPVLTVATCTDDRRSAAASDAAVVLRLPPLSADGSRSLLTDLAGPVDDEVAAAVYRASGGNPLILTDIVRDVWPGEATPDPAAIAASCPARLIERFTVHLRALPDGVRAAAQAIAVLAGQAAPDLVSRVAALDAVTGAEALRVLDRLGLTEPGNPRTTVRFVHAAAHEAAEASMTGADRERAHLAAARLLSATGHDAEQVAAHLLVLGPVADFADGSVLRAAAGRARTRGAFRTAAKYLRRVLLDGVADDAARAEILVELALAERAFDPATAVRRMTEALALFPDDRSRAAAAVRMAPTIPLFARLIGSGLFAVVHADLAGATSAIDRQLATRLEARLRYATAADPVTIGRAARRLEELGADRPLETPAERELVTVLLHAAAGGVRMTAADAAGLAHRLLGNEPPGPEHVHSTFPLVFHVLGAAESLDAAEEWLASAYLASSAEAPAERALIRAEQAFLHSRRGALGPAHRYAVEADDLIEPDWGDTNAICMIALVAVAIETRDGELADRLLRRHRSGQYAAFGLSLLVDMLSGATAAANGDLDSALERFLDCGRRLDDIGWVNPGLYPWRFWAASVQHRRGDAASARRFADEAYQAAVEWGADGVTGRALRLLGQVGDGPAALRRMEESVELLEHSVDRLEFARALVALGRRRGTAGQPGADELLDRGRRVAAVCGADWLTADASPPERSTHLLTATERRVAGLVADRRTNREIAAALGVSSRAVEKHLTNLYRKLGLSGRSDLMTAMDRSG
jgi:DNA-binding CsgD family transcriptional regulator